MPDYLSSRLYELGSILQSTREERGFHCLPESPIIFCNAMFFFQEAGEKYFVIKIWDLNENNWEYVAINDTGDQFEVSPTVLELAKNHFSSKKETSKAYLKRWRRG